MLLNSTQVAENLGKTKSWVVTAAKNGRLRDVATTRPGAKRHQLLFDSADVARFQRTGSIEIAPPSAGVAPNGHASLPPTPMAGLARIELRLDAIESSLRALVEAFK